MKTLKYALLSIMLSGCATFGQMEEGLQALMGKSEQIAFSVLGYPSNKQEFSGDIVYIWYLNQSGIIAMPQTATTTGYIGTTPVYGSTTYMQQIPVNYSCTIKLIASGDGMLKKWEYNGNIGGCTPYINRLKDFSRKQKQDSASFRPSTMSCEVDSDCSQGYNCRSRRGGGTECRPIINMSPNK
jgi:hypothetical protein